MRKVHKYFMKKYAEATRSIFYYQLNRLKELDKYKEIKEKIIAIYHENKGRYGYRRITLELINVSSISHNPKVVSSSLIPATKEIY